MKNKISLLVLPVLAFGFQYLVFQTFGVNHDVFFGSGFYELFAALVLGVIMLPLVIWHFRRLRNNKNNTVFLAISLLALLIIMVLINPSKHPPIKIIAEMRWVKAHQDELTVNDNFLDPELHYDDDINRLKIMAANKKFGSHLLDNGFGINIQKEYIQHRAGWLYQKSAIGTDTVYATFGIMFNARGQPVVTDKTVLCKKMPSDSFVFVKVVNHHRIMLSGNKTHINVVKSSIDTIVNSKKDSTSFYVDVNKWWCKCANNASDLPWAYKIFYSIL